MTPSHEESAGIEVLSTALRDRYRLEEELGRGAMARVYRAADLKHSRAVAIKVLKPELQGMIAVDRFLREIRLTFRRSRRTILLRNASRRRRVAARPADPRGAAADGRRGSDRPRGRRCAALRAPVGSRAPRYQTGEHPPGRGTRPGVGFRHCTRGVEPWGGDDHRNRYRGRDAHVYEPRAGGW